VGVGPVRARFYHMWRWPQCPLEILNAALGTGLLGLAGRERPGLVVVAWGRNPRSASVWPERARRTRGCVALMQCPQTAEQGG